MSRRGGLIVYDDDDDFHQPASLPRRSSHSNNNNNGNNNNDQPTEDPIMVEWERRLNAEVDEDFFEEPRKFQTLHRVIDVLGLQLLDGNEIQHRQHQNHQDLMKNPAYKALKKQQQVVENAIEHMAMVHCADLNSTVVQVGKVARQFNEAIFKVRTIRRQVRDIQDTLGSHQNNANPNEATGRGKPGTGSGPVGSSSSSQAVVGGPVNSAAMSLRELWLKKLECEAVLSLLGKLEIIRAAPSNFDALVQSTPNCRIAAAVVTLSVALQTMFSDDIAQVQALYKIMEQLMLRKQRAEEIIWDTLSDVIFLRTGNNAILLSNDVDMSSSGVGQQPQQQQHGSSMNKNVMSSAHSLASDSRKSGMFSNSGVGAGTYTAMSANPAFGMNNPFCSKRMRFAVDDDLNDGTGSVQSQGSASSLFSDDGDEGSVASGKHGGTATKASSANQTAASSNYSTTTDMSSVTSGGMGGSSSNKRMMIPTPLLDAELDLEADERRCLEEAALSSTGSQAYETLFSSPSQRQLPRYADHVLALRILVECLTKLNRLDDIERVLTEGLEREIRRIAQREQARTLLRMERQQNLHRASTTGSRGLTIRRRQHDLKDVRRHLMGLLSAFGCVMIRLSHLAQILRHRITNDKGLAAAAFENPTSALQPVLATAYNLMQQEIKDFLKACLTETEPTHADSLEAARGKGMVTHERGFFSLGILDTSDKDGKDGDGGYLARANIMELSAGRFVVSILIPRTNLTPQSRHALTFRKSLAKWTMENEALKKELAMVSGEDTSAPSYIVSKGQTALDYLDNVIKKQLLPLLQEDAVNGTVRALEREDAFDPLLDRTLYVRPNSNEPQDVDMSIACQALYQSTGPLFMALHRLPRGGEMYLPLVAVLEHVILTFISRVKQRVATICNNKTSLRLLLDTGKGGKGQPFGVIMERRKAFAQLLRAYANVDLLESQQTMEDAADGGVGGLMPLSPPSNDTQPRRSNDDGGKPPSTEDLDFEGGVEREEQNLAVEATYLQSLMDFTKETHRQEIITCSDEELMKASCLAHSLLKLSSLLENRLKVRGSAGGFDKSLSSTRALREAIKTIKANGVKMAKICRIDMLLQTLVRLSKICKSSTVVAKDAVRIPSSVNDLGEYLTGASDNLREAAGNAVTAYTFSSLEQYIPLFLIQTVRVIASGQGSVAKAPLTLNGVESLDRSGSVLYRDLKGATSFDNSFWDDELAAISFERSASFMAMMELEMEELESYYTANHDDFSDEDFQLMFSMNGPRRKGDIGRYHMLNRRLKK